MASNIYTQNTVGGKTHLARRSTRQGRRSSGLGTAFLQRLYKEDEEVIAMVKERFGYLYSKNDFVRSAVKYYINHVYTELLIP